MSAINTENLGALCDEYLARMAKGELSAEDQKDAASILDDRIRQLANTDTYQAYLAKLPTVRHQRCLENCALALETLKAFIAEADHAPSKTKILRTR